MLSKALTIDGISYKVRRIAEGYPTSAGLRSVWVLLRKTHDSGGLLQDAKVYMNPEATLEEAVKRLVG